MRYRHKLRFPGEQLFILMQDQLSALVTGDYLQDRAGFLCNQLPRNDVGMVFQYGYDDFITWSQRRFNRGVCHQIDAFGGAPDKDDLLRCVRSDEPSDRFPGVLIGIR